MLQFQKKTSALTITNPNGNDKQEDTMFIKCACEFHCPRLYDLWALGFG
jgi:hypothetical protein